MDLPFLMLVLLLTGIGVIMVFSASYATAYYAGGQKPHLLLLPPGPLCRGWPDRDVYHLARSTTRPSAGCRSSPLGWLSCCSSRCSSPASTPAVPTASSGGSPYRASEPSSRRRSPRWPSSSTFPPGCPSGTRRSRAALNPRSPLSGLLGLLDRIGFLELVPYGLILGCIVVLMMLEPHMSGTILILVGARRCSLPPASSSTGLSAAARRLVRAAGAHDERLPVHPHPGLAGSLGLLPGTAAIRSSSPSTPSAPADCWAWAWARAGRSSSTCPSRRTTSSSPSSARSWA